jgi:hypothetical protein
MERSVACPRPPTAAGEPHLAELAGALADRYRVFADGRNPHRGVRFVAIARTLAIRPYAIVTADLDELRRTAEAGQAFSKPGGDRA